MTPQNEQASGHIQSPRGHGSTSHIYALSRAILELMSQTLKELVESGARCAVVVDRTGCIMSSEGNFTGIDPGTMGATAAATVAALNKLVARESSREVSVRFYDSAIDKIHFVVIDKRLTLCLLYNQADTGAGIRAAAKAAAKRIADAIAVDRNEGMEKDQEQLLESVNYIEGKLDELFKDFQG